LKELKKAAAETSDSSSEFDEEETFSGGLKPDNPGTLFRRVAVVLIVLFLMVLIALGGAFAISQWSQREKTMVPPGGNTVTYTGELSSGSKPAPPTPVPPTPTSYKDIFEAAAKGTVDDVRDFIEAKGIDINTEDDFARDVRRYNIVCTNGWTPVMLAAGFNSDIKVLEYLIEKGSVDINAKIDNDLFAGKGGTLLQVAALYNTNAEVLKFLIDKGADADVKDEEGATLLCLAAARNSSIDVLNYLINDKKMDVNTKDKNDAMTLHYAAMNNQIVEVLKYL